MVWAVRVPAPGISHSLRPHACLKPAATLAFLSLCESDDDVRRRWFL